MVRLVMPSSGRLMGNVLKNTPCYLTSLQPLSSMPQVLKSSNAITASRFRGWSLQVSSTSSWRARRNFSVHSSIQPGTPPSSPPGNSSLVKWILGILITVILPLITNKWTKLLKFKDEVETVIEESEQVIEVVEDIAEAVDKVVKDVADHLPQGGKLNKATEFVEDVAEEIIKDARLAETFIDKVEKVEDKIESIVDRTKDATEERN